LAEADITPSFGLEKGWELVLFVVGIHMFELNILEGDLGGITICIPLEIN
jgi:hypothetical protein